MFKQLTFLLVLLLAGCAATGPSSTMSNSLVDLASPNPVVDGDRRATLAYVREIDIKPQQQGEEIVCEEAAPTGTRIAKRRCFIRSIVADPEMAEARRNELNALRDEATRLNEEYIRAHSRVGAEWCPGC